MQCDERPLLSCFVAAWPGGAADNRAQSHVATATERAQAEQGMEIDDLVKAGKFREDLYYRINVIELKVPALRDRRDDLPMLIDVLLDRV